jgi:YjbE family integral membrane protein
VKGRIEMTDITNFIIGILQITLLDFTLSGDNIGVIALATKNLSQNIAEKARITGAVAAIILRIIFACGVTFILSIDWLPIKLVGGLLLIKITWDFIKPSRVEEDTEVKATSKFWDAIFIIVLADLSMSLDNVLAIAAAADGNVLLIIFGILLNIPIIIFGSKLVANLMNKHKIVIYLGGAILAHTSFKMVFEDKLIAGFINHYFAQLFPWAMALAVIFYGIYLVRKDSEAANNAIIAMEEASVTKRVGNE